MNDERPSQAIDAPPSFAFLRQTGHGEHDALLIWPVAEQRPAGAFARFVVIEGASGTVPLVVPMDFGFEGSDEFEAGEPSRRLSAVATRQGEDAGSLPLLVRFDPDGALTVQVKYLVRRPSGIRGKVEEVALSPVSFRELESNEADRLTAVGFARLKGADGPTRPRVLTGLQGSAEDAGDEAHGLMTHVEIVDAVFCEYEKNSSGPTHTISTAFVFAVPSVADAAIGPVRTIFPYRHALIRAAVRLVPRGDGRGSESPENGHDPRLALRIGASIGNRAALEPGVLFFHWSRTDAALQAAHGRGGAPANEPTVMKFYRGRVENGELAHTFEEAGFGDVIGLMVGPRHRFRPVFPDLPDDDPFLQGLHEDWTFNAFLWTGDEVLRPLSHYVHPELNQVFDMVQAGLSEAAYGAAFIKESDPAADLASYLLPRSPRHDPGVDKLIRQALDFRDSDDDILVLDPYCEFLRELDWQLRLDRDRGEWRRISELFSFANFKRLPPLYRALVVEGGLRRRVLRELEVIQAIPEGTDLLALILFAFEFPNAVDQQRATWWRSELGALNVACAWELIKREPESVCEFIALGIAPDLVALADHFAGQLAMRLQTYRRATPEQFADAAENLAAVGQRRESDILLEVSEHRRGEGAAMGYERITAALARFTSSAPLRS